MDVALSSPRERGLPFSVWSVPKLAAYCRAHDLIPPFCDEWVRRLLRGAGMRAQRIRTWKTSHDPAFDREKIFRTSEPPRILPRAACPLSVNDRLLAPGATAESSVIPSHRQKRYPPARRRGAAPRGRGWSAVHCLLGLIGRHRRHQAS